MRLQMSGGKSGALHVSGAQKDHTARKEKRLDQKLKENERRGALHSPRLTPKAELELSEERNKKTDSDWRITPFAPEAGQAAFPLVPF